MLNTLKWIILAPIFLTFIYVAAIFSPAFRAAIMLGIQSNIRLLEADMLTKKMEADK